MHDRLIAEMKKIADPKKAAFFPRFFKTGPGEYGEGDVFLGVTVPQTRRLIKAYRDMPLASVKRLLKSDIHEHRLAALFILVDQFGRGGEDVQKRIIDLYLENTARVNNWDLVDSSADKIVGAWVDLKKKPTVLDTLARSKSLWDQRIAIVATFHFIRKGDLAHTFRIADMLIDHSHDLIRKAVGWMLRETGKKNRRALEKFLKARYKTMPRTMLRYAIERFEEKTRKRYLAGAI